MAEHDTYSIFSIYIVRWVQVQITLILILAIATLTVLSLGQLKFGVFKDLVLFVFRPLINIQMLCYMQVYLFMTGEQIIMRSLILFEKDKDINEVTYIYNNTNLFMVRERKHGIAMKLFYTFNLIFCSIFIIVIYYEGLDEVLDDRLDIDDEVVSVKNVLYYLIVISLITLIIIQLFVEFHIFFLMCKLHYIEFKRVKLQMMSVLAS